MVGYIRETTAAGGRDIGRWRLAALGIGAALAACSVDPVAPASSERTAEIAISLCGNGIVTRGEACDDHNLKTGDGCEDDCTTSPRFQQAYIKASNTGWGDFFGDSMALSADGSTLAVGASNEMSPATGVDGDQGDGDRATGAVYVFTRTGAGWAQQAYIKASNTGPDLFGDSVALSADGSTLAVSAIFESSAAIGIGGDQTNDSAPWSGAVYVFTRSSTTWSQQAYIKASNTSAGDFFGSSVALSADGSILAVGAPTEDSAATGTGGDQGDNSAESSGAVYMFARSGATWSQQAYVKASNAAMNDGFGSAVALSTDGSTLAVGARGEASAATGVGGDQTDDSALAAGAVYMFTRSGATWSQQAYLKASNTGAEDCFGSAVALSADGSTLAVGARGESSAATGIGGDQTDDSAWWAGAVYVFARSGATWSQQAYLKASNTGAEDGFGNRVALAGDGSTLAVGAPQESSASPGVGGDQTDDSAWWAGAVYVFTRSDATWSQRDYVKASNPGTGDVFGHSVALAGDGSTLAVGAYSEDSAATGIDGDQADDSMPSSGAVYVFR